MHDDNLTWSASTVLMFIFEMLNDYHTVSRLARHLDSLIMCQTVGRWHATVNPVLWLVCFSNICPSTIVEQHHEVCPKLSTF